MTTIRQIAVSSASHRPDNIYALRDDGEIFVKMGTGRWEKLATVPPPTANARDRQIQQAAIASHRSVPL